MRLTLLAPILFAQIHAATVEISSGTSWTTLSNIGNAKFRFSQTNWDQSLGYGAGTPNSATFVSRDLGTNTSLNQRSYDLLLSYDPLSGGFAFSMSLAGSATPFSTLQWMSSSPIGGRTPSAPFNAIEIDARANLAGATLNYSNIRFSGNVVQFGAFESGTASDGIAPVQWLVSDNDLSQIAWTLAATVSGQRLGSGNDEAVRMVFTVKNVAGVQPLPEPSTWLMLTAGLFLMWMSVRRNRRAENKGSGNNPSRTMR